MARLYYLQTTARRQVALDVIYQCKKPACGFSSLVRCWGAGTGSQDTSASYSQVTEVPFGLKVGAKRQAEMMAWESARKVFAKLECPRCSGKPPSPSAQFASG